MDQFAIVTAFGQDRPGIVALMADSLYHLGCNVEDSSMTRLRGEFTMMLMVRLPQGLDADALGRRLTASTRSLDLAVLCRALPGQAAVRQRLPEVPIFMLSVYGADHPGIVAHVARTVCRRAERALVRLGNAEAVTEAARRYVNRLSDLLFVIARALNVAAGRPDVLWEKGRVRGGGPAA